MGIFSKTLVCALVMAGAQTAYAADIVTATGWLPMPLFRSR